MWLEIGLLLWTSVGSYSNVWLVSSCFRCRTYSRLFCWSHSFCTRISDSWRINARSSVLQCCFKIQKTSVSQFFHQNFETHGTTKKESLSACVEWTGNRAVRGIRINFLKFQKNSNWNPRKSKSKIEFVTKTESSKVRNVERKVEPFADWPIEFNSGFRWLGEIPNLPTGTFPRKKILPEILSTEHNDGKYWSTIPLVQEAATSRAISISRLWTRNDDNVDDKKLIY